MKIALDMDEVLCSLVEPVLCNRNFPLKYEQITNYNLREITDYTKEEAVKLFMDLILEDFQKNHKILTPLQYTVETVRRLKEIADKIYVVTARPEILKDYTLSWFEKYFENLIDDVVFMNKTLDVKVWNKWDKLKELWIDLFVDDNLENVIWAVDAWIEKVFLVDKPWNQVKLDKSIIRIAALNEVLDYVD